MEYSLYISAPGKETEHAFVNVLTRGDLSSLRWIQSPLKYFTPTPTTDLCSIHYASLNFRDIMLATGKLPPDAIPGGLANQDCLLGMEFSGYNSAGKRVMGLVPAKVNTSTHELIFKKNQLRQHLKCTSYYFLESFKDGFWFKK